MKTRFFSVLVLALGIALSVSMSSEKGQKSTKATSVKKEMKSCCSGNKQCSDKDMKDCAAKEGKSMKSSKSSSTKEADKTNNENKKN